jgi:DNA-binding LacI/PurR family transcriptional regulator
MLPRQKRAKNQGHRVTLKFIAEHLGLSPTTISIVLSNSPLASTIAGPTKLRIWEAAKKFSYRPNLFARSLQSKRSYSIAVLVPEIGDEFSSMLISGIESKLGEARFNYFVESHRFAPVQIENSPDTLMDRMVEGMIFINTPLRKSMPVPVVAISDITRAPGVKRIVIDNNEIARIGMEHLKALGHTRVAFFKGPEQNGDTEARWAAISRASRELGLVVRPELTVTLGTYFSTNQISMMQRGYEGMAKVLRDRQHFTAVLAFNDKSAIGAIRAIQDQGLQVPGDISVIGVDDLEFSAYLSPRLTTIRQPLTSMGAAAATTLLREIHGEEVVEETVLQPQLVVRESTAPVSSKR